MTTLAVRYEGALVPFIAGESFDSVNYRIVKLSAENTVVTANDAEVSVGISTNNVASGGTVIIQVMSIAKLTIGSGGCSDGDFLNADANGKGVVESTTNVWYSCIALQDGSENDVVSVLIVSGYISSS